ncbi:MAG: DNA translocase FtsK [Oscillospiraceae bacterium]|nr:DNA translocase FtsK [Oscillospiraceae bacterium]
MATNKKNNNAPRKNQKKVGENRKSNKQLIMIFMFAASLLWLCIALIDAGGLWGLLRTLLFGLFGFGTFVFPLLLLALSVVLALERNEKSQKVFNKLIYAFAITFLLSAIIHIFNCNPESGYFEAVAAAYENFSIEGKMTGGGALGALLGGLFLLITGGNKLASLIILFIILFVVIMVVTGLTIANIYRGISKPVKKIGEFTGEKISEYSDKAEALHEEKKEKRKAFNPDVDLGPDPITTPPILSDESDISFEPEEKPELIPLSEMKGTEIDSEIHTEKIDKVINLDDIIRGTVETQEQKEPEKKQNLPEIIDDENLEFEEDEEGEEETPYMLPTLECLRKPNNDSKADFEAELKQNATKLVDTLKSFGVETRIVGIERGPSVTRYEIQPAAGVKISKITNLTDDIALNLASSGVRIEAPIPNKSAVGIEVPNKNRNMVTLREVIDQGQYREAKSKLTVGLGKDVAGNFIYSDIAKMPHLLIAGTTGSGKSVCLNTMIVSLLYNATPDEVKLLMIDPKQVEFTIYNGIPHLLVPVVSDARKAAGALGWAVSEMLQRYKKFSDNNVRDISGYNSICESEGLKKMPQIVIFIDELSDLMMAAPNEVEDSICRLAQMARAAGMHLVIATQRPSVDVITGLIKANIPSRIALSVSSQIDSRTIIDSVGAEKLLGNGDMLYYPVGIPKPIRVQGCYLSENEVAEVVKFIKEQKDTEYDSDVNDAIEQLAQASANGKKNGSSADMSGDLPSGDDEILKKAIEVVVEAQSASTTLLQKRLKLGYARASRIIDELEEKGVIGQYEGSKPRKVLLTKQQWFEMNAMSSDAVSDMGNNGDNYD